MKQYKPKVADACALAWWFWITVLMYHNSNSVFESGSAWRVVIHVVALFSDFVLVIFWSLRLLHDCIDHAMTDWSDEETP